MQRNSNQKNQQILTFQQYYKICEEVIEKFRLIRLKIQKMEEIMGGNQLGQNFGKEIEDLKSQISKWIDQSYYNIARDENILKGILNIQYEEGEIVQISKQTQQMITYLIKDCENKITEIQTYKNSLNSISLRKYKSQPSQEHLCQDTLCGKICSNSDIPQQYTPEKQQSYQGYLKCYHDFAHKMIVKPYTYENPPNQTTKSSILSQIQPQISQKIIKSQPQIRKQNKTKIPEIRRVEKLNPNNPIVKRYIQSKRRYKSEKAPLKIIPSSLQKSPQQNNSECLQNEETTNQSTQISIIQINDNSFEANQNVPKNCAQIEKSFLSKAVIPDQIIQNKKEMFKYCVCKGQGIFSEIYSCPNCNKMFHYQCTMKKVPKSESSLQQIQIRKRNCHFCFMKVIDPLNQVQISIQATYLTNISIHNYFQFINFQLYDFYLTSTKNSKYEIEIRCMKLEDAINNIPQYTWPDESYIKINNQKAFQFQALPRNSSVKKRKDYSAIITNYIYQCNRNYQIRKHLPFSLQMKQYVPKTIPKKIQNNHVFFLGIYLTKKKTPDELCEEIKKDPHNKVSFASSEFSKIVNEEDEELEIQEIKVSMLDPFTWNIIDMPVRGNKCTHAQCFDLKTFLSFMYVQKARSWKCPVCNKYCQNFQIDTEQLVAIQQFKKHQQLGKYRFTQQIAFHRDGRTTFILQNNKFDEEQEKSPQEPSKTKQISKVY